MLAWSSSTSSKKMFCHGAKLRADDFRQDQMQGDGEADVSWVPAQRMGGPRPAMFAALTNRK